MTGTDSLRRVGFGPRSLPATRQKGRANADRTHRVCTTDGRHSAPRLRAVRRAVPRPASGPFVLLLRPVPLPGLRPGDVPGEPSRHRDLLARRAAEALPRGPARPGLAKHPRGRERDARLADLRRLRPDPHSAGPPVVLRRALRRRVGADGVRLRCDDDRSLPRPVPLGPLPAPQGGREAPHAPRPARPDPDLRGDHRRESRRCDPPRCARDRARGILRAPPAPLPAPTQGLAFFVIRGKRGLDCVRRPSRPVDRTTGLRSDQTIVLCGPKTATLYPVPLRRIRFLDPETGQRFVFLTNNFTLPPFQIAQLYKCRWQIELFFKWIKQHLRIKAFYGTSVNAVKTQIWIAISVYVLVAILKRELRLSRSLSEILQILSVTLFERVPLSQVVTAFPVQDLMDASCNQLPLFAL